MIPLLHAISKWGSLLWTLFCMALWFISCVGMTSFISTGQDYTSASVAGTIGSMFLFAVWFFPTIIGVVVMYVTRPQAWKKEQD